MLHPRAALLWKLSAATVPWDVLRPGKEHLKGIFLPLCVYIQVSAGPVSRAIPLKAPTDTCFAQNTSLPFKERENRSNPIHRQTTPAPPKFLSSMERTGSLLGLSKLALTTLLAS